MKKYLLLLFCFPFAMPSSAQNADEWLRQKETALKYALEQLVALQSQSRVLKKGYAIVETGLETLATIKGSDYNLHEAFQASLKKLKPSIRKKAFMQLLHSQHDWLQAQIRSLNAELYKSTTLLAQGEKVYLAQVLQRLGEQVSVKATHFDALCNSGELVLGDAERLERIAALYQATREDLAFLKSFTEQTKQLLLQRRAEQATILHFQKIQGL